MDKLKSFFEPLLAYYCMSVYLMVWYVYETQSDWRTALDNYWFYQPMQLNITGIAKGTPLVIFIPFIENEHWVLYVFGTVLLLDSIVRFFCSLDFMEQSIVKKCSYYHGKGYRLPSWLMKLSVFKSPQDKALLSFLWVLTYAISTAIIVFSGIVALQLKYG
ncbi:hypothetical protein [Catenovulum sediminis]|uniref:Uncharacterized protein n=1 Tax=Catenovulum sediminis TaxID=1740262 RepID=A0ABV1RHX6_9ALTE